MSVCPKLAKYRAVAYKVSESEFYGRHAELREMGLFSSSVVQVPGNGWKNSVHKKRSALEPLFE